MSKRRYEDLLQEYSNSAIATAIDDWIRSEQDRRIAVAAMLRHETYAHIAEAEQLDEQTISRRMRKIENAVYRHI